MDRDQRLALARNAHLTVRELQQAHPDLAAPFLAALAARTAPAAAAVVAGRSERLRRLADDLVLPLPDGAGPADGVPLRVATVKALRERIQADPVLAGDPDLAAELEEVEAAAVPPPSAPGLETDVEVPVADVVGLDDPIMVHPEFGPELARARLDLLTETTGLDPAAADVLSADLGAIEQVTDQRLAALVDGGRLSRDQASAAGKAVAIYQIVDERPELAARLGAGLDQVGELARLDQAGWVSAIQASGATPPGGLDAAAWAGLLARKVELLFPTQALGARLTPIKPADVPADLGPLALRYPGQRLAEVDDGARPRAEVAAEVSRRVGLVGRFLADNPDAMELDLTAASDDLDGLTFDPGAGADDRAGVLATVRAYTRMGTLTGGDVDAATKLVAAGYHGVTQLAAADPDDAAAATGLPQAMIKNMHDDATDMATKAGLHLGDLLDRFKGDLNMTEVGNQSPAIEDYLKQIPGFAELFGSQDFCRCTHCRSILGPAAYLYDLLGFVDDTVTRAHFTAKPNHPLALRSRRPDLYTLELTCENTNKVLPYLTVINEVMENAVAADNGFAGDLRNRAAVEALVYEQTLPGKVDSFQQPFHLPIEELKGYLGHFGHNLADLAEAGGADGDTLARLRLGLAPRDFELITTADDTIAFLRRVYGVNLTEAGAIIAPVEATGLLGPMGVTRDELGELLATSFVVANTALRIVAAKRTSDSVQNDVENVVGSTRAALDRLHRFVRLWRATGWRVGELDLVLGAAAVPGTAPDISARSVAIVAAVHRLAGQLGASVEELIGLWALLPVDPVIRVLPLVEERDVTSVPTPSPLAWLTVGLLGRLFNPPRLVAAGGPYPQDGTVFVHPGIATTPDPAAEPHLRRLAAGLGVDEDGLYRLVVGLAVPLGIDPGAAADADKGFTLSRRNLTLLWRHARLAKLLGVGVAELFALAALAPELELGYVEDLDDLQGLLRLRAWKSTTRWSTAELLAILRPGTPAMVTSVAPVVGGNAPGGAVTCTVSVDGTAGPAETVTLVAGPVPDPAVAAVVAAWNAQATATSAYRSDAAGVPFPNGLFLSLRATGPGGPGTTLTIGADAPALFKPAAAPALTVRGRAPSLPGPAQPAAADLAAQLVAGVADAGSLTFADTVFSALAPLAPVVVSRAAVAGAAGGESVTVQVAVGGLPLAPETVTLAAGADLAAVVADWNAKARRTSAYRANANGLPAAGGDRLAITMATGGADSAITVSVDSAGLFIATVVAPARQVPLTRTGAELTDTQSRAIVAANLASFEPAGPGRYRLAAGFDPAAALTVPATIDQRFRPLLPGVLAAYHGRRVLLGALPGVLASTPAAVTELAGLLGTDLGSGPLFAELRGDVTVPARLAALIDGLRRLARLFADTAVFDAERLAYVGANAARFGLTSFERPSLAGVRAVERFRSLLSPWVGGDAPVPDLEGVIARFDSATGFVAADRAELARALGCEVGLLRSLDGQVALGPAPLPATERLGRAVDLSKELGTGGALLGLVRSTTYAQLAAASAAVQAAFRAAFADEQAWEKAVEPYLDALLSRRRDGLVADLLRSSPRPFDSTADLYHYYLLDVQLEGCARTSRVAAAIDSVQLYVQRCLLNYEESPPGVADPVHVLPGTIPERAWSWRSHYRVWQAARELFINPESYVLPEQRHDRTHLFKELEETLLSKEVTEDTILDAYSRYLRGFEELAHLTIAGAYHERDDGSGRDTLHLFGVNSADPPVYYYRRVENARSGVTNQARATVWGPWEPLDVQIPVRKVSPVVYQGQLSVYWVRYTTNPINNLVNGKSEFSGYQHKMSVEFTIRRLDGSWSPPQKLRLTERPFDARGDGVFLDPIVPKQIGLQPVWFFNIQIFKDFQPLFDDRVHEHPQDGYSPRGFMWDQVYASAVNGVSLRGADFQLWSAVDLYRLAMRPRIEEFMSPGDLVPWLNPSIFIWIWLATLGKFDLTSLLPPRLVWSRADDKKRTLHSAEPGLPCFDTYTLATLMLDEERVKRYARPAHALTTAPRWNKTVTDFMAAKLVEHRIGEVPLNVTLDVVNGSVGDVFLQTSSDAFYLQQGLGQNGGYRLSRLGSSVSADIGDTLFNRGLEQLLATSTQMDLKEHATGLSLDPAEVTDASMTGSLDLSGPMGTYLRELFLFVPWLIASYYNAQGDHERCERWYRYSFDPTSSEIITGIDPALPAAEQKRRALDRVWRYREFRNQNAVSLRADLTSGKAIDAFHRDPFDPHAIAAVRPSAYPKAIVVGYIDNLLDWGDELFVLAFARANPEYLREATQKYVTAWELLGPRPALLGDCGESVLASKTYQAIKAATVAGGSEFLIELESIVFKGGGGKGGGGKGGQFVAASAQAISAATTELYATTQVPPAAPPLPMPVPLPIPVPVPVPGPGPVGPAGPGPIVPGPVGPGPLAPRPPLRLGARIARPRWDSLPLDRRARAASYTKADVALASSAQAMMISTESPTEAMRSPWSGAGNSIVGSIVRSIGPAFCIPRNERLLDCWDRVEDRLYKLRHCLDIDGVARQLPLFAARIDPGLLAGGRAAGLTLEDVLAGGGEVPPYRFQYLLERARSYTATVQALGAGLLSALEKRDLEELTRLRNTHQRNVLALTTELRSDEVKLAKEGTEIAKRKLAAAEYRRDYYGSLLSTGMLPSEIVQVEAQALSAELKTIASIIDTVAAIAHLVPDFGSPFSMKFGGIEVGLSSTSWSMVLNRTADVAELVSTVAGLSAGQERREQGWEHQRVMGQHDVDGAKHEVAAAELREGMAQRGLEIHRATLAQQDEVIALTKDKFTNLALYTWLTRSLQRLHREAYLNALTMASLAERAYHFERPGDATVYVGGEWDGGRSGLLAGDRLAVALQRLERRFIEQGDRELEVNQSFSLAQLDPAALVALKETGSCEFAVSELHLDLFYAGQYRRRIRSVRLTMPCITGPYTNVSARLSLVSSHLRKAPGLSAAGLVEVPPTRTRAVAMSTAQGDAGVFELSFRDERYMPFEGAGAVSRWRLELPKALRTFDYHSITDVILNLSYTAQEDGTLRDQVEERTANAVGSLLTYLRNNDLVRVFSLRQEFSSAFTRLLRSPANTQVTLEIDDRHFPLFLAGRTLRVSSADMVLGVTDRTVAVDTVSLSVDGTTVTSFPAPGNPPDPEADYGGLPAKGFGGTFTTALKGQHTLTVAAAGNLAAAGAAGAPLIDEAKLRDVLLVVRYRLATAP
jgi:hypothetical protein